MLTGKKQITIFVVILSLIVGMWAGSGTSTAKETIRIDKKIAGIAKGSLSKKKAKTVTKTNYTNYTYRNDDNLYVQNGKYLEQYTLDGKMVNKWNILPKVKPNKWYIVSVNNKEILYIQEKNKKEQIWSIPLVKTKTGDKLKLKKAKKVLTLKKGSEFGYLYVDNNYIAYTYDGENTEHRYAEYDRKTKKYIAIDSHSNNIYVTIEKYDYYDYCSSLMEYAGTAGIILGIYHYDPETDDETAEGIYFHKLGSGKVTKIGENYTDYHTGLMTASYGKRIFYTGVCRTTKDMENENQSDDIYVYDAAKKKARIFISGKRLHKKTGEKKTYLSGWKVDEGRLYLFVERDGYDKVLSCSVKSASKLIYEKKLNKFVKNKYYVHDVIKGRFFCSEPGNDEGVEVAEAIFYKKTGKGRILKKGDREWDYWMYNNTD